MRITNNMLVKDMLWNANKNLVSMSQRQRELSTGRKIHRPSDDPVGTTQVLKYKTDIREAQQYKKNISDGLGWLEVTESSLISAKEILHRVRELTIQAANGTNTPEDTQKIQIEIEELTKELIVIGNATSAGRHIFSGLETDQKLFNPDGTFNIDMTSERVNQKRVMAYEVSVGETMPIGTHPVDVFGVVSTNNFFEQFMVASTLESGKATQTDLRTTVDITGFDGTLPLSFDIGGTTFTAPTTALENIPGNRMTKERLLDAIKNAEDGGGNPLSSVANVYFDSNDKLVIQAKAFGSGTNVTQAPAHPSLTGTSTTLGEDATTVTTGTTGALTDADVAAATGVQRLAFQLDGERYKIDIDMGSVASVADLQNAIQTALDGVFTPVNPITVSATVGSGISFSFTGPADGKSHVLKTDYVVATESAMISDLKALATALSTKDDSVIQASITKLDLHLDKVVTAMGEIGGKTNRIEFVGARVTENEITFTGLLSKVQDVDMAEAIMYFKNLENIYRASLSVGSKVIQPSLVDFIR